MGPGGPFPHDEQLGDVHLYERLTNQVGETRYNPTGTTWVWAFRGTWQERQVMVFRPGEWLWDAKRNAAMFDRSIMEDLGSLVVQSGNTGSYTWAVIDALPGVRLRSLVAAAHARGTSLPIEFVLDIAVRTGALAPAGDTFIGWDGELWLCPRFQSCWDAEMPSSTGAEVFDILTVRDGSGLAQLLGAPMSRLFRPIMPNAATLAGPLDGDVADIVDGGLSGSAFIEPCRTALRARRSVEPEELGAFARELMPESYERQHRAAS